MSPFTERVIEIVRSITAGNVLTYGEVARLAGNPKGARAVSYILHSSSSAYDLPWHRVVGKDKKIHLVRGSQEQRARLEAEGVEFDGTGRIIE